MRLYKKNEIAIIKLTFVFMEVIMPKEVKPEDTKHAVVYEFCMKGQIQW